MRRCCATCILREPCSGDQTVLLKVLLLPKWRFPQLCCRVCCKASDIAHSKATLHWIVCHIWLTPQQVWSGQISWYTSMYRQIDQD